MSTRAKPSPVAAFQANMEDAHHLVRLAESLTNQRTRRARRELRHRLGTALRIRERDRDRLDCLESSDVFLVFKPNSCLTRGDFDDHRPLLRQALVAACAATETYLADKVTQKAGLLLRASSEPTDKMKRISMTIADWLVIENYDRRRVGLRRHVERHIAQMASTSPNRIGELLSLVGVSKWTDQMDHHRKVSKGDTQALLDRVTRRRNLIVHTGDRSGRGRAQLSISEVKADLAALESVVDALEKVLA